jgi:hypothetical protein
MLGAGQANLDQISHHWPVFDQIAQAEFVLELGPG